MDTYWGLYWITRLEGVNTLLKAFGIISVIICIALFLTWLLSVDTDKSSREDIKLLSATRKTIKRIWVSLIPILIVLWTVFALIPTQKEAIFIVAGGKTLNWAIQDSSLSRLPSQSTQLMSTFLEQQINSLTKDVSEEVAVAKDSITKEIKSTVSKNLLK